MSYAQDQEIAAADFNTMITTARNVYGTGSGDRGYGQSAVTQANVTGGYVTQVTAAQWLNLRSMINTAATHQGSSVSLPATTLLDVDDIIQAHPPASGDFPTSLTTIDTNRLNVGGGQTTVSSAVHTATRNTAWSTTIDTIFTVTFASGDAARYFFNSGGQIRLSLARSGGTGSAQNTEWTNILTNIGLVTFAAHATTRSGSLGTAAGSIGYYELTTSYQTIFNGTNIGSGAYSANDVTIEALSNGVQGANGDTGSVLTFRVTLADEHATGVDNVDGTLTLTVDQRKATTTLTIASPSYAETDAF